MIEHISCANGHGFEMNLEEKHFHTEILIIVSFNLHQSMHKLFCIKLMLLTITNISVMPAGHCQPRRTYSSDIM